MNDIYPRYSDPDELSNILNDFLQEILNDKKSISQKKMFTIYHQQLPKYY